MPPADFTPASDDLLPLDPHADRSPAVALAAPGRVPLAYTELQRRLDALRTALLDAGVRPAGVVALALPSGPEFIVAFLAASAIGACAPLDPALTEPECRSHLLSFAAQAIICEDGAPAAAALSLGIQVLTLRSTPGDPAGVFALDPIASTASAPTGRQTDAALLLHTSATTGTPKLVPLTRANLRAMALHDARALQLTAADRFLSLMPLFHLHGISAALTQLSCGGTVIATAGFDAASFLAWLSEFQPTWFSSTPTIHRIVCALAREHPNAFRAAPLRLIRSTGAGLDPALLARLEEATGVPVLEGYGLTETGGVARSTLVSRRPGSVGRTSGLEIAIVDAAGAHVPPGLEGEIAVRGPSVASAYLDDPGATQAAFRNGWFHTGDLGHLDSDGFLFLSGRLKEMINRGGEKIVPEEVDRALAAHPTVAEAAAFAAPHQTLGEDVAAVVVLRGGGAATELELRRFAATRLAYFKVPRRIVIADRIPRGPTGKPRRALLAEQFRDRVARREPARAPLDSIQGQIAAIWSRVLGIGEFDPEDDFFLLGGDSLTVAMMLAEVCRTFRANPECFPALDFFDRPSIASLAGIVEAARADSGTGDCVALRTGGSRTPLFCVPASNQSPYYLRHLAKSLGYDQPFYAVCPYAPPNSVLSIEDAARLAVDAIRRARPQGPYVVAGHCYGGVVAFEAARQLILQRERVVSLVLFDTPAPGYPKIHRHWLRYAAQAREMVSALARGRRPVAAGDAAAHLRALGHIAGRRFTGRAARAVPSALLAGREQQALNGLAMRGYSPRDLCAPIVQFIPADHAATTKLLDDPRLGWRDFARAGFEVRTVAGDHNSMFEPSRADALADHLRALLEFPR